MNGRPGPAGAGRSRRRALKRPRAKLSRERRRRVSRRRRRLERRHGSLARRLWLLLLPLLDDTTPAREVQRVFELAIVAWNLPFRDAALRRQAEAGMPPRDVTRLRELYARRLSAFGEDPRMVVRYDLIELDGGEFSPLVWWTEGDLSNPER